MNKVRIPTSLQVAESVTAEEYRRSRLQFFIVMVTALSLGIGLAFPLIYFFGLWQGIPAAAAIAYFTEIGLGKVFKDAHKMRTHRMKQYKKLMEFKRNHNLLDG